METKHLKKYAPEARRDFIEAVMNKAAVYGLLPDEIFPMQEEGDVVIIGDRPFPISVAKQRKELEDRIRKRDSLVKQRDELREFDEKLRHFADQRIELDLDDGVKVNYGKFSDLLAEVKTVTGKKPT